MGLCDKPRTLESHARADEEFTTRVAQNTGEACDLIEAVEYVTGEYRDGGKSFRRRKCHAFVWFGGKQVEIKHV